MSPSIDEQLMQRACRLALQGQGTVEPNPMVGCVIARGSEILGEGWHQAYGGDHAEVVALHAASGSVAGATAYVTLEPCCHQGQTPPCTDAIIAAEIGRVVVAMPDPFPAVNGGGIQQLKAAGIEVTLGVQSAAAARIVAPYLMRVQQQRTWVIAKWAMSLDGKIATSIGDSQWISNRASRRIVHQIRGRVDAIIVGAKTAIHDNPRLTARPSGPRTATRIVLDSQALLPLDSQLVQSATEVPTVVVCCSQSSPQRREQLTHAGCEVLVIDAPSHADQLRQLLELLAQRGMTNVLVEGGGTLLGTLRDGGLIDEVHVFIASSLLGGEDAITPMAAAGCAQVTNALRLHDMEMKSHDGDIYIHGCVQR